MFSGIVESLGSVADFISEPPGCRLVIFIVGVGKWRAGLVLVPTLCVGTRFSRRSASDRATQSVAGSAFPRRAWERGFN